MSELQGRQRADYVREMFSRIASRYDLLNRLMTFGRDVHWRRECIALLDPDPRSWIIDLGAGTGDLALEVASQHRQTRIVAADFTREMLQIGRQRDSERRVSWVLADALALPFKPDSFRAVVSGFLMRNLGNLEAGLAEQLRILQKGSHDRDPGRIVILETTPPKGFMKPLIAIHLRLIIPLLGALVSGDLQAYRYLPATTEAFLEADELADRMRSIGFHAVSYVRKMVGTVAIHSGLAGTSAQNEQQL